MKIEAPNEVKTTEALVYPFEGDSWILPTDLRILDRTEEALRKKLIKAGWVLEEDKIHWLLLITREMLINALVHGNLEINEEGANIDWVVLAEKKLKDENTPENIKSRQIFMYIDIDAERAEITIRDEGKGFDYLKQAKHDPTKDPEEILRTSGRGIWFARNFVTDFRYSEGGKKVKIIQKRKN